MLVCCSIILASKFDPIKLLPRLLPYLNPSCPFVVFSDYLEVRLPRWTREKDSGDVRTNQGGLGDDGRLPFRFPSASLG